MMGFLIRNTLPMYLFVDVLIAQKVTELCKNFSFLLTLFRISATRDMHPWAWISDQQVTTHDNAIGKKPDRPSCESSYVKVYRGFLDI